jgi:hypothetical protein
MHSERRPSRDTLATRVAKPCLQCDIPLVLMSTHIFVGITGLKDTGLCVNLRAALIYLVREDATHKDA